LRRVVNRGWAILGANELGHALGRLLRDSGEDVIFLDSNPTACHAVEQDGFRVVFGNVLEERTLFRAKLDDRAACIAVTPNEEANLLFARRALEEFKVPRAYVALARGSAGVSEAVVRRNHATVLFGQPRDLELWALRLRRASAAVEMWRLEQAGTPDFDTPEALCLPLVVWRGDRVYPVNGDSPFQTGDVVQFAILTDRRHEARAWLEQKGWRAAYSWEQAVAVDQPAIPTVSERDPVTVE
jgi:hypothetical protein